MICVLAIIAMLSAVLLPMRCLTIMACLCVVPRRSDEGGGRPRGQREAIAENAAAATSDDLPTEPTRSESVRPPAVTGPPPSSEPAPKSANPLWSISLSALTATQDRPIFSASRRPPSPPVAPLAIIRAPPPRPTEPEKPHLMLVGTIVGDAESFGIFVDQTSCKGERLCS